MNNTSWNELKNKCLSLLRNEIFYKKNLREYIENHISDNLGFCCRTNKSVNEWKPDKAFLDPETKKGLNQKTVFLTARMFDLWEEGLIYIFNNAVKTINSKLSVVPSYSTTHDFKIIYKNKDETYSYEWEVKTTTGQDDSFTSITHGKNKCPNYVLIKYKINKDIKLNRENNKGFLESIFVVVWNDMNLEWKGDHTDYSSWTTLKIPVNVYESNKKILVLGEMNIFNNRKTKKLTYCKFKMFKWNVLKSVNEISKLSVE